MRISSQKRRKVALIGVKQQDECQETVKQLDLCYGVTYEIVQSVPFVCVHLQKCDVRAPMNVYCLNLYA